MSTSPGSFRPDELAGSDADIADVERAGSYAAARELEQALTADGVHPSAGFADRVMAAIALEPAPRPTGFLAPLRARHSLAGVVASVRAAWIVASGGGGRPARARGLALAYVLAVMLIGASLTGVAAFGTAGAIGFFAPDHSASASPSPSPSLLAPEPTASPDGSSDASASPEPSESAEPSGSPDASESAEPGNSSQPGDSSHPGESSSPRASEGAPS
ncbi:MAG: hypothetical protein HY264_03215, partial [Chloroflexi bacterium]|nr:hypothetical protein [Chloroflexota bacterium]